MNKDPLLRWYIEHGICIGCRQENAMPGRQKCPECLYKNTLNNIKYRSLEKERKRYAKRKEQRERRIAAGMCPICGKPATNGQLCTEHYIRKRKKQEREKEERRQRGNPKKSRVESGLCYLCTSPAMEGYKVCRNHYEALMNRPGFGKNARKGDPHHPWIQDETKRRLCSMQK